MRWEPAAADGHETLGELIARYEAHGADGMADAVFETRDRFSDTSLSRAAYVLRLAWTLEGMAVDTLEDLELWRADQLDGALPIGAGFDAEVVRRLASYAGADDFVWVDADVRGFVASALKRREVSGARAALLVRRAAWELVLAPRAVDRKFRFRRATGST